MRLSLAFALGATVALVDQGQLPNPYKRPAKPNAKRLHCPLASLSSAPAMAS